MDNINILIADGHFLTREGLKSLISVHQGYMISGEAEDNTTLYEFLSSSVPDILIMDYNIRNCFSLNDLFRLHEKYPEIRVLVITNDRDKPDILAALECGVYGYLLKECDQAEILRAIHSVFRREKFLCGKVLDVILDKSPAVYTNRQSCDACEPVKLSQRELEVIKLVAKGYTTKEIAGALYLSNHTIATHRKNIFKKIGINNATELVRYAMRNGIVSLQ